MKQNKYECRKDYYCQTLRDRSVYPGKPGISITTYISLITGKKSRSLVIHRMDAKDKTGMVLNGCPWCRFDFSMRPDWPQEKDFKPTKPKQKKKP